MASSAEVVATCDSAPFTVTASATAPTEREKSITEEVPTFSMIQLLTAVLRWVQ
jgi:hypothetical protein